jgi:hypothetical protein
MEGKGKKAPENVVRFPRDWVGPLEDLVPIGSRARAREQRDADDVPAAPPAADDFWSESSSAVHAAIQGPARDADPVVTSRAPRTGTRWWRRRRFGLPDLHVPVRWSAVVAGVAVVVVLVVAVIGLVEGSSSSGSRHATTQAAAIGGTPSSAGNHSSSPSQPVRRPSTSRASGPLRRTSRHARRTQDAGSVSRRQPSARTRPRHHPATRSSSSTHAAHRARAHRQASVRHRAHHASGNVVRQVTVTVPAPTTAPSTEAPVATSSSPPVSSAPVESTPVPASAGESGGSAGASAGPAGPTGVGSVGPNCNPKCS